MAKINEYPAAVATTDESEIFVVLQNGVAKQMTLVQALAMTSPGSSGAVRFDAPQSLMPGQQTQGRANILAQKTSVNLDALAALTWSAHSLALWTAAGTASFLAVQPFMEGFLGAVDATVARAALNITLVNPLISVSGFTVFNAATQDGVHLAGRAGGSGSFTETLTPAALTASRTATFPDLDGTVVLSGANQSVSFAGVTATALTSTIATGTPPLTVASTTVVANLNVATAANAMALNGATFAAPGAIGGTTPGTGAFTTLNATGQILGDTLRIGAGAAHGIFQLGTIAGLATINIDEFSGSLAISGSAQNVTFQSVAVGNGVLLRSTINLTNGAGAQVATLNNSPTAGNPTKWVAINDNGTTRYIPAW